MYRTVAAVFSSAYLAVVPLTKGSYSGVSDLRTGAFVNVTVKEKDWSEWCGMRMI